MDVEAPDLQSPTPGFEITFDGVAAFKLGQTFDPNGPVDVRPHDGGGSCGYWGPSVAIQPGDKSAPLAGLVSGANTDSPRIESIKVWYNPRYRTVSGVGVGTKLSTLKRIYGGDLTVDRADGWDKPTDGLLGQYQDVAAVSFGGHAITYYLKKDVVDVVKVSYADFWGDDEGCA